MHHDDIDRYAHGNTAVHRLDPRAKALAVLAYTLAVISVDPFRPGALWPFAVLPVVWLAAGRVPWRFVAKHALLVSPFVLAVAAFNPVFDARPVQLVAGGWTWTLRAGWVSAAGIVLKFFLCVTALLALSATTPFPRLMAGAARLGVPRALLEVLGLLYRYLFVLVDQALRMRRAAVGRGWQQASLGRRFAVAGAAVGALFLRSLERAERVHLAMCARGYDGRMRTLDRLHFHAADTLFMAACLAYALGLHLWTGAAW